MLAFLLIFDGFFAPRKKTDDDVPFDLFNRIKADQSTTAHKIKLDDH
jgi:hypothetical protein